MRGPNVFNLAALLDGDAFTGDRAPSSTPPQRRPARRAPSLADYLAAPSAHPEVAAAGRPPPMMSPQPVLRGRTPVAPPIPQRVPTGPGGVLPQSATPPAQDGDLSDPARYARMREAWGEYGAQAGRLAAASRYAPRYRHQQSSSDAGFVPPWWSSETPNSRAAAETGVSREYLDTLIAHESGGNPEARATTSSATGPAQFIDSTWLRMMRQYADDYGLPEDVSDDEILALRTNQAWASIMAAEYARENRRDMTQALRRPITEGEAYLAHFLGAGDATKLISGAERNGADARRFVSPGAVEANRNIFYDRDGRPRTAREVVALQSRRFRSQQMR